MITHQLDDAGKILRIDVAGDLLSTNFDQVNNALQEVLDGEAVKASSWSTLLLDLTTAKLIDSMGLNVLVGLVKRIGAPPRNGRIKTRITSPTIHRTLLFTRLEKYMEVELVGKAA
jgi:anti-anti-sigma factor